MESPDPNSPREEIDGEQNAPGGFVEGLKRFFITWKAIITHPRFIEGFKISFNKPVYLAFVLIVFAYALGYYKFHVLWCLICLIMANSMANLMLKRYVRTAVFLDRKKQQAMMEPSVAESGRWLNEILAAVYKNHHRYISHLFVRFIEPLLNRCCAPPPIDHLLFDALDIGEQGPVLSNLMVHRQSPNEIKYDFDCDYHSDFNGVVICKMAKRTIPTYISNLYWKAKMRFVVTFVQDRFPFISRIRMQLLERPTIDISVKCEGLPDMMEMPVITSYFVKLVIEQMCHECLYPEYLEGVLCDPDSIDPETGLSEDEQKFMNGVVWLAEKMIEHGIRARFAPQPRNRVDGSKFPTLGAINRATRTLRKMSTGKISKSKIEKLQKDQHSAVVAAARNALSADESNIAKKSRGRSSSFDDMESLLKMAAQAGHPDSEDDSEEARTDGDEASASEGADSLDSAREEVKRLVLQRAREMQMQDSSRDNRDPALRELRNKSLKERKGGGSFIRRFMKSPARTDSTLMMDDEGMLSASTNSAPSKTDFLEAPSDESPSQNPASRIPFSSKSSSVLQVPPKVKSVDSFSQRRYSAQPVSGDVPRAGSALFLRHEEQRDSPLRNIRPAESSSKKKNKQEKSDSKDSKNIQKKIAKEMEKERKKEKKAKKKGYDQGTL